MIIPFETGIPSLLKEKGFDVTTNSHYLDGQLMHIKRVKVNNITSGHLICSAPDYDQVLDWLQQNHKMYISARVDVVIDRYSVKWYYIFDYNVQKISKSIYPTRYEALNAGIIESLKLIK